MDVNTKVLDVLFRRVSPNQILTMLHDKESLDGASRGAQLFQSFAVSELREYTLDELNEIFRKAEFDSAIHKERISGKVDYILQGMPERSNLSLPELAIHKVLSLSEQMLTQRGTEPLCKIEQVLLWRERYLLLGQDLFVCAYLAQEDISRRINRESFVWPAVLQPNHAQLEKLLNRGIAENHQHLFGSSQTFALSWCSVMNYPDTHRVLDEKFGVLFQPFMIRGSEEKLVSTKERVRFACLCRYMLFSWLKIQERRNPEEEKIREEAALWGFFDTPNAEIRVLQKLPRLRIQYGAKIPQRKRSAECLDYALEEWNFQSAPDAAYRSLAGERYFLYQCFRHFLLGKMSGRMEWLFYLYLILKSLFRSELIQVNQQMGFANFSNYQDRKDDLCNKSCYQSELLRMAISAPLKEGNVISLESRISPRKSADEDNEWIRWIDREKQFADLSLKQLQSPYWRQCPALKDSDKDDLPYFFVYHFIKQKDQDAEKIPSFSMTCRHHRLRQTVREQSIALTVAMSQKHGFSQRVRGIDSASHEIGCPPEVFAPAFRYLRHFQCSKHYEKHLFMSRPQHILSATYHVGEDFLDITSALRAIDEAIVYLELQRGDRLGHALGLGIDPLRYYELKQKRVYVRKQDRLDDLVWLLYRGQELNISFKHGLAQKLETEANTLLNEIYGDVIRRNGWYIDLHMYYESMKLRADEPSRYVNMRFDPNIRYRHQFDEYALRCSDESLAELRKHHSVTGMYYYYHYGREQKIRGSQPLEREISSQYVEMIRDVQKCLQEEVAAKGIIIECNPSSNVLIGTFEKYHNHPIFRFSPPFSHRSNHISECGDIQVCINTDDLGVFDTSQAFEYALLYQALNETFDENGQKRYSENEIMDYLEMLRKAGLAAVFPKIRQK